MPRLRTSACSEKKPGWLIAYYRDMDDEMINARDRLASKLFFGADMLVNGELKECNGYTKKDLLKLINVFDEIKA